MIYSIGIDIGSTCAKTAVIDESGKIIRCAVQPTGWSSADTAIQIREGLRDEGIPVDDSRIVATGYGRISVPYADQCVTEITCHALGAGYLTEMKDFVLIDIGGQDTKIITVKDGAVTDFLMNDKCSAGTGRFLEVMSGTLGVRISELCDLAMLGSGITISSLCTVFAESEVINLIGRGEKREDIAYAVVDSIVKKVSAQARKLIRKGDRVYLTGGLCELPYLLSALSRELRTEITSSPKARFAGAIGAAIKASRL